MSSKEGGRGPEHDPSTRSGSSAADPSSVDPGSVEPSSVEPSAIAPCSIDPSSVAPGSSSWPSARGPSLYDPNATRSASPSTAGSSSVSARVLPRSSRASATTQLRDPERYLIIGEHGRGGLGRVSRAHDRDLGRDVAIKELISRSSISEVRFLREALITARLEHPGIVPVHEAGRWPDGTPFYAMKLVAGRPLRDLIAERTTVAERIGLLHHVIAVADAIAYAHEKNIIHRDLKPANVIVGDFGETIVIDWGLAKDLARTDEPALHGGPFRAHSDDGLTAAGSVLGTPAYMAPEQERGEQVDQRADVFAIGAMLWELSSLQKVPPTDQHLRHRMLRRAGIERDLVTIIDKALNPDPKQRYTDAGALAADLKAFKSGSRIAARSYSLYALLAHWTRHHRALTLSLAFGLMLLSIGMLLYVRDIRIEQARANAALAVADDARKAAATERDRAQLSEASLLAEKDPTRAKQLLATLARSSAQHALLASRAHQGAASHTFRLPGNVTKLFFDSTSGTVAVATSNGLLASIDIDANTNNIIARSITAAAASGTNSWLYSHHLPDSTHIGITDTSEPTLTRNIGPLLADLDARLLLADKLWYALDHGTLYVLRGHQLAPAKRDIRSIAGDETFLLSCSLAGVLDVSHAGKNVLTSRCAANSSKSPMVAAGRNFAALMDSATLLLVRESSSLKIAVNIPGEYALALSRNGMLAIADLEDRAWLVRPGSEQLEQAPRHPSQPSAVATVGPYAAWGYMDGSIMALDTRSNTTWAFKGHADIVGSIAIDPVRARIISIAGPELRVWSLPADPLRKRADVPCKFFNMAASSDQQRAVIDCADGSVRVWHKATGSTETIHHHNGTAYGVAWYGDHACSGSFDGSVLCTPEHGKTKEILGTGQAVRAILSTPDKKKLIIATSDGLVRAFDGAVRSLYTHKASPYRMAISADGQFLASGTLDGTVIVYDLVAQKLAAEVNTHTAFVSSLRWRGHDLWTASADGNVKHWIISNNHLEAVQATEQLGVVRFLHLIDDGWVASVNEQTLLLVYETTQPGLRIELGRRIERIDVSPTGRYIVAAVTNEIILLDTIAHTIGSLRIPADGIGFVGFSSLDSIALSTPSGLYSISPQDISFSAFTFSNE